MYMYANIEHNKYYHQCCDFQIAKLNSFTLKLNNLSDTKKNTIDV